jgi:hypothetical protein
MLYIIIGVLLYPFIISLVARWFPRLGLFLFIPIAAPGVLFTIYLLAIWLWIQPSDQNGNGAF